MNKQDLTEKYQKILNEQGAGPAAAGAAGGGILDTFMKMIGAGAGAAVGGYTIYTLADLAKQMMSASSGSGSSSQQQQPTGDRFQLDTGLVKRMARGEGDVEGDYSEFVAGLANQPVNKRTRSIGRQRALAANLARRDMLASRQDTLAKDKNIQSLKADYERASAAAKSSTATDTHKKAAQQAAADLKAAEKEALSKSSEYTTAKRQYGRWHSETSPIRPVERRSSDYTVDSKGNYVRRDGGGYVNPNSPEGRIAASIASGAEGDMARTPGGRLMPGGKSADQYAEDLRRARQEAAGFNIPRGMTDAQFQQRSREEAQKSTDQRSEKIRQEVIDKARKDASDETKGTYPMDYVQKLETEIIPPVGEIERRNAERRNATRNQSNLQRTQARQATGKRTERGLNRIGSSIAAMANRGLRAASSLSSSMAGRMAKRQRIEQELRGARSLGQPGGAFGLD